MEKIARRAFCGTAFMAFPLLNLIAGDDDIRGGEADSVLDVLADEISRITADGARDGFRGEHFRRYAGILRAFDAHLEDNGTNREVNRKFGEEGILPYDAADIARTTAEYWERKGIHFDADDLTSQFGMDPVAFHEIRRAVKRQGGVRTIHRLAAEAFERKAKEVRTAALRGRPAMHNGRIIFARYAASRPPEFMQVQYDFSMMVGSNLDCLCAAMKVEIGVLALLCACGVAPACVPAGVMGGMLAVMEGLGMCNASRCWS